MSLMVSVDVKHQERRGARERERKKNAILTIITI